MWCLAPTSPGQWLMQTLDGRSELYQLVGNEIGFRYGWQPHQRFYGPIPQYSLTTD